MASRHGDLLYTGRERIIITGMKPMAESDIPVDARFVSRLTRETLALILAGLFWGRARRYFLGRAARNGRNGNAQI